MFHRLLAAAALALGLATGAGAASPQTDALADALGLPELFSIMREEGIAYGHGLEKDLFAGNAGPRWSVEVANIYDAARIYPTFLSVLDTELKGTDTNAMLAYLTSDEGARVVKLELDARKAFLDDAVREAADARVQEMTIAEDPRLSAIETFIEKADLLEGNVANAMNGTLAFYQGLAEGGAMPEALDEGEMLRQVWAQEPDIRDETESWLLSYLATAYAPLSERELDDYIAFYETPAGQALNRALFAAFDTVFSSVSHDLGLAASQQLMGQDL